MWKTLTRKMKDSGVEWIGEIPEDWDVVPTKRFYKNEKEIVGERESQFERLALTLNGVVKRSKDDGKGLQPAKFETYQILYKGELVFKLIDLENVKTSRVGYSNYTGLVSPVYIRLINSDESKFGYYYFTNMWHQEIFNYLGSGVRSNLTAKDLLKVPYLEFTELEKKKIVQKLNTKTKYTKFLIEQTQQSIIELKKYKQSLITEAVTKGLDPNVEMKDSGIEWIGKTPVNWMVIKLNQLFSIKKNIANKTGYDVLSVTQRGLRVRDITKNEGQMSADYSKYQIVEKDDFVMNHMDLLTGWVDIAKQQGVTSPDYRVFFNKQKERVVNEFFLYIFQTAYTNKIFYGLGQGVSNVGRWRLQTDKFLNFYVPLPSIEEQRQIVSYLDEQTFRINKLIEDKTKVIEELENYKKSLIYEYVTGKKEV